MVLRLYLKHCRVWLTVRLCFLQVALRLHEAELSCLAKSCLEETSQLQCWSSN